MPRAPRPAPPSRCAAGRPRRRATRAAGRPRPDLHRVLADPAREDERIEAAERGRHRRDARDEPVHVDVEGQRAALVARPRPGEHLAHVAGAPRQAEQAGLAVEGALGLLGSQARLAHDPQHEPGIDRARARRHHEALERREAHGRVDAAPARHRRQ